MKNLLIAAFCIFCLSSCDVLFPNGGYGGNAPNSGGNRTPQQTPQQNPQQTPQTQTPIDRGVSVRNIQLTNDYTILSMTCTNNNRPRYDQNGRMINDGSDNIAFHPQGVLIGMNGARRFKFVKVEGIPTDPQRMVLKSGQRIDFTVFFERLDRGIEEFDLFECQDGEQYVCWNLYNLYVKNPAPQTYPQQTPTQTPTQVPPSTPTKTPNAPVDPRKLPEQNPPTTPTPTPVVLKGITLKGIIRDAKTNLPITAKVNFVQSPKLNEIDSVQSFQESGLYRIRLEAGNVYSYTTAGFGYLVSSDVIDLSKVADGQTITKDIYLKPFEVGTKISLKNIYFEIGKYDLLDASFAELDKLVRLMRENPNMRIRLEGHTDVIGDPDANQELSQNRVDAVREYLVQKGVLAARIETVGYGGTKPIKAKGTDAERAVNRRVEFVILKI